MERSPVRKYILDASVAVKWFVDEQHSDHARRLKDKFIHGDIEIVAPDLLKYEVASALRWHPIALVDRQSLTRALSDIEGCQFLVDPPRQAWSKAIELSYASHISPYDGIYMGLAHVLKSPLVTADERLIHALPKSEAIEIVSLAQLAL